MKKILLFGLLGIFNITILYPQVTQDWVTLFNYENGNTDTPADMVVDSGGNIYITGWTTTEVNDFITIKYNSAGELQWSQFYNGPMNNSDKAEAIAIDDSGNVYVIGRSQTQTWGDITIIKYSPDGDQLWIQYYDNTSTDGGYDIGIGNNGMVYAVGFSNSNIITLMYNPEGELQWVSTYNGLDNGLDIGYSLVLDDLSNVYITGYSAGVGTSRDITTIKYNSEGIEQWVAIYDGPGHFSDEGYEISLDEFNNVYVIGYSNDESSHIQFATIKYNNDGTEEWVNRFFNPQTLKGSPKGLAVFDSDNIYVCGSIGKGYATVKLNALGDTVWTRNYGLYNSLDQLANDIITDNVGNLYVTGWTRVIAGSDYRDYGTVKYDPDGNLIWDIRYEGPAGGRDDALNVCLNNENKVIVTGETYTGSTSYDIGTISYSQTNPNSVFDFYDKIAKDNLFIYPNPAVDEFQVRSLEFRVSGASLEIFDLNGRKRLEKQIPKGTEEFIVDVSSLNSGLYFCRIQTENGSVTKKLIIQK